MANVIVTKVLKSQAGWSSLFLRVPTGIIFAAHGAQKLFGWFDGNGLTATAGWMESMGMTPGILMALLAGGTEFFGGLALVVGLLTRPAALGLAFTMVVAIVTVHWDHGLFLSNNGYEFALSLLAACIALLFSGAGKLSVDNAIAR